MLSLIRYKSQSLHDKTALSCEKAVCFGFMNNPLRGGIRFPSQVYTPCVIESASFARRDFAVPTVLSSQCPIGDRTKRHTDNIGDIASVNASRFRIRLQNQVHQTHGEVWNYSFLRRLFQVYRVFDSSPVYASFKPNLRIANRFFVRPVIFTRITGPAFLAKCTVLF